MGRTALGAIVGYVVMLIFIIATFTVVAPLLGMERLFEPGTWDASSFWLTISISLSVVGAILGGMVATRVGRSPRAATWLAVLVFVLGTAMAVSGVNETTRGGPRAPEATIADAGAHTRQPTWLMYLNPLLGAAGVLVGGRGRRVQA